MPGRPSFACQSLSLLFLLLSSLASATASYRVLSEGDNQAQRGINNTIGTSSTQAQIGNDGSIQVEQTGQQEEIIEEEQTLEPALAVLFPAFALTLGVVVYFLLSRYVQALPFTAVMFIIGTLMGIGVELVHKPTDQLAETTHMWANIEGEVLLLVFLPGLVFKDAMGLNVHLFRVAVGQCVMFAFPLVLGGTLLTAAVALYVFPYGWSFNFAMTFGCILSATDPVAVAALLEEVGAPPRLRVHIAGEALLNDGSAIVFYSIFVQRVLADLHVEGIGEEIGWAEGFREFFRMSLGGVAVGTAFGLGLLAMLYLLNRRYNREENVVEVTATMAVAYINYYVADLVCHTSGVIATVACGVTVKFFGRAMINDAKLLDSFWTLVEHLLNTILFLLGGAVWGTVIADGEKTGVFTARDWGYLILLYVSLSAIRMALFALVYPITVRTGLRTNWKETIFQVYGGLRGAVGIALVIALDNSVSSVTDEDSEYREQTRKAFGMIGGIAFLTLVINGATSGPLLRFFGLADSTETREKIVEAYQARFKRSLHLQFISLLTERRFRQINFGLVKHHVPYMADMTKAQLVEAIERHKDITATDDYFPPYLKGVLPYLTSETPEEATFNEKQGNISMSKSTQNLLESLNPDKYTRKLERDRRTQNRTKRKRRKSTMQHMMSGEPMSAQEMRSLFISVLKANYEKQIEKGELADREFLALALQQSLEFAADRISNGAPLQDWEYVHILDGPFAGIIDHVKHSPNIMKAVDYVIGKGARTNAKTTIKRMKIERSLSFMVAHRYAQKFFQREFEDNESELDEAAKLVISESQEQLEKAEAVLQEYKKEDVENVVSHKFCSILLNFGVHYVTKLVNAGLLKDAEAEEMVEEIEEHLDHVVSCAAKSHEGEVDIDFQDTWEDVDHHHIGESGHP